MNIASIAAQAFVYWLLFPAVAIPVCLLAARRGHHGFVERLVPWFAIIPVALGASYLGRVPFALLLVFCCVVASWELARLGAGAADRVRFAGALACSLPWVAWAELSPRFPVEVAVTATVVPAVVFFLLPRRVSLRWSAALLGLSFGAALSFWVLLQRLPGGFRWVLVAFSVVVLTDVMAFATGRFLPGPRPFPTLSPGKTITGYAGGVACGVMVGFILSFAVPEFDAGTLLAAGVLLAGFGAAGDLVASAVKRRHATKDFSRVLGAQGGMLDRLDSLLGAGWVFYLFVRLALGWS